MTSGIKVVLLMLAVGIVPTLLPMPSLLATICMAPLLLLVPTGIGFAVMSDLENLAVRGVDKLQATMIAYFLGLFIFIATLMLLERFLGLAGTLYVALAALAALSVVGWQRAGAWAGLGKQQNRTLLLVALIALPLIAVRYGYGLAIYSEYPVTDLFQRSHFQGGAMEFARTLVLNPFVAQSYIPFQQLFLGIVSALTGADPLDAEWVWPLTMAPLQVGAVLCVARRLTLDRTAALFAMALVLSQFGLSNPTNGTLAELAVLVLLSLLLPTGPASPRLAQLPWAKVAGLAIGLLLGTLANSLSIEYAVALVGFAILSGRVWLRLGMPPRIYYAAALTMVALPLHRGALLFVAFAAAVFIALYVLNYLHARFGSRALRWVALGNLVLLVVVGLMGLKIVFFPTDNGMNEWGLWGLFDRALTPITGKSLANVTIDGDLAPGAGARVALFEIARSMSLLAFALTGLGSLAVTAFTLRSTTHIEQAFTPAERHAAFFFVAQMLIFTLLLAAILTGFPFIHRAGFFEALLLGTALAALAGLALPRLRQQGVLCTLLGLGCASVVAIALLASPANTAPYLDRAAPILILLGAIALVVPLASRTARPVVVVPLLAVVSAVGVEIALSRTYFKPYAFQNQVPPESGPLAAFDLGDLDAVKAVLEHTQGDEILVSDPKSMTFLRSRTGLYPLMSVSNLDTMEAEAKRDLHGVLLSAIQGARAHDICADLQIIAGSQGSAINNYASIRRLSSNNNGAEALRLLGYDNRMVPVYHRVVPVYQGLPEPEPKQDNVEPSKTPRSFLINVNPGTLSWLENPDALAYFPVRGALPPDITTRLSSLFPEHYYYDGRFFGLVTCA